MLNQPMNTPAPNPIRKLATMASPTVLSLRGATQCNAIIGMLTELESTPVAIQPELLTLLNTRQRHGRGCGPVDISLLASVLLAGNTRLWTLDTRLDQLASELNMAYRPTLNS